MHHRDPTPLRLAERRAPPPGRTPDAPELRWQLLDLVRSCREPLGLRDRDITVLRGLLSLLPAAGAARVFASNRVLQQRCDGMDERTLRRRLQQLQAAGLITRHLSPNGKRYQLRDADNVVQISYGFDLGPLFALGSHLQALAEAGARAAIEVRLLRARIRDALYHGAGRLDADLAEHARLSLRRKLAVPALQSLLHSLLPEPLPAPEPRPDPALPAAPPTMPMTASDGQNDRHIQRSNQNTFEPERGDEAMTVDLDPQDCLALAPGVAALCPDLPRSWAEMQAMAHTLAPAIGIPAPAARAAEAQMGSRGFALAILGMVEAFERIRNPGAYLGHLSRKAAQRDLNPVRMYRSLIRAQGTAAA